MSSPCGSFALSISKATMLMIRIQIGESRSSGSFLTKLMAVTHWDSSLQILQRIIIQIWRKHLRQKNLDNKIGLIANVRITQTTNYVQQKRRRVWTIVTNHRIFLKSEDCILLRQKWILYFFLDRNYFYYRLGCHCLTWRGNNRLKYQTARRIIIIS